MPTIYDVINVLPFDAHNWFGDAHKQKLSEFISQKNIKTVLEVGSWMGGSTRFLAKQLPPDGFVIAVDTWKGSEEHQPGAEHYHHKLDVLYQQFLSNTIYEKLENKIIPVRMSSIEAASAVKTVPDLFYLDAGHDEKSIYNDLNAWWKNMAEHTIICGDDYNPQAWPGVVNAVHRFASEQEFTVKDMGGFWWYERGTNGIN